MGRKRKADRSRIRPGRTRRPTWCWTRTSTTWCGWSWRSWRCSQCPTTPKWTRRARKWPAPTSGATTSPKRSGPSASASSAPPANGSAAPFCPSPSASWSLFFFFLNSGSTDSIWLVLLLLLPNSIRPVKKRRKKDEEDDAPVEPKTEPEPEPEPETTDLAVVVDAVVGGSWWPTLRGWSIHRVEPLRRGVCRTSRPGRDALKICSNLPPLSFFSPLFFFFAFLDSTTSDLRRRRSWPVFFAVSCVSSLCRPANLIHVRPDPVRSSPTLLRWVPLPFR